jgi:hypothetical protein
MLKPAAVVLALLLIACETAPVERATMPNPSPTARLLPAREATFHLSAEDRTRVSTKLDADALEEVLAWLKPEYRGQVLEAVRVLATARAVSVRIVPLSENDPEWVAAPEALKSAIRQLSVIPNQTPR